MLLANLLFGCIGFILSGNALTRFKDTKDARWLTTGIGEILIGGYFMVASIGIAGT